MSSISTAYEPSMENPVYILHSNAHLLAQCASVLAQIQEMTDFEFRAYPRNNDEKLALYEAVRVQSRVHDMICLVHDLIDPMCDQIIDITDHYDLKLLKKKDDHESDE